MTQDIKFQRRHYDFMAKVLRNSEPPKIAHLTTALDVAAAKQWRQTVRNFATALAPTGGPAFGGFNRARFLEACGVSGED